MLRYSIITELEMNTYNKKYWPHQCFIDTSNIAEAERWCWKQFKGKYWSNRNQLFVFKRSEDAVLFALRWT